MSSNHKFLMQKSWHPSNKRNQKKIWIAEQTAKQQELNEIEASKQIQKQTDLYYFKKVASSKGDEEALKCIESESMSFMYIEPPGYDKSKQSYQQVNSKEDENKTKLYNSTSKLRNLEKCVGIKPVNDITIKDQIERFPFLKDAPVEGDYAASVKVNFKPLGKQLRNVRCIRCGEWGHQSGDRECSLLNYNPNDASRQVVEDPMSYINKVNAIKKHQQEQGLALKEQAIPMEMKSYGTSGYELLVSSSSEDNEDEKFIKSLTSREKKKAAKKVKKRRQKTFCFIQKTEGRSL